MKRLLLLLFVVSFTSCSPYLVPTDGDDLYYGGSRYHYPSPYSYNFWSFDWHPFRFNDWGYRYYSPFYSPRTIIVVPKSNNNNNNHEYGKRPDRSNPPRNNPPISGGRKDIRRDK